MMSVQKSDARAASAGAGGVLLLALVLAVLFWRSFLPEYIHFSNDGPLGQQAAAAAHLPRAFYGVWNDNNDIGGGGGSWPFGIYSLFNWLVGPVGYAKFLAPFDLFILGLGAWTFFRQLKLSPLAATLGALAAALNSTFFSTACWGVAPQEGAVGMDFFALALVVSITAETPLLLRLARLALAGLCVGENVIEASDIGAIFSVFVSGFILVNAFVREPGQVAAKIGKGVGQIALVAVCAGFIATQAVVTLVGTQIQGVVGTSQDAETKAAHWDPDTQWSLPKVETLAFIVPGLFGYKMDTPQNMDPHFKDYYEGGNYWGGMGRDPAWDRYFAHGSQGPAPQGYLRQTGGENYAGVLVVLIALWAMVQGLRKQGSVFSDIHRRYIWFWTAVVVLSILLAWGRFSVFYAVLYQLPYVSVIRSPTKFIIVFSWAIVVLFAHGIDGLSRCHLTVTGGNSAGPVAQLKKWWATAAAFDRKWTWSCLAAVGVSLLAWLIFAGEKPAFSRYLQTVGFPNPTENPLADTVAAFSINQAGWFVVLLAVAAGLCVLIISGCFTGSRTRLGGLLLGLFLLADMGRANLPYIIHWDYKQKYDIDPANPAQSINPILNLLRDKSYEHRVSQLPFRAPDGLESFENLYTIEWMQHQFPYYNIQSLEVWQRPRVQSDIAAYESAVYFHGTPDSLIREWQLTNTRYILGPAGFIDALNAQVDPEQHRFRMVQRFNVVPKAGISHAVQYSDVTAVPDNNGDFALFEFTGALPRAKLYSNWQVNTNDQTTLKTLASKEFDPAQTVLVATPTTGLAPAATNENTGSVEFKSYTPTKVTFAASTPAAAVMLWNDKYDPHWQVSVDGQPASLLRCNFIMRGVYLKPGSHMLTFKYTVPNKPLFVTMSAFGTAILLGGFLLVSGRGKPGQK
jgi:hypothetical protein